tara:strand:+ start:185 stop:856 length:672 start_codon:yes stop_codon:yes gene_type:complete
MDIEGGEEEEILEFIFYSFKSIYMAALESLDKQYKIEEMNKIIKSEITQNMISPHLRSVTLKYRDIKLDMLLKGNTIKIVGFSRIDFVRTHPQYGIGIGIAQNGEPAADKGDGSLFLALVVIHCDEVFTTPSWIILSPTEWWNIRGVCKYPQACLEIRTRIDNTYNIEYKEYQIDNRFFLYWSERIINSLPASAKIGGKKLRKKKSKKKRKTFRKKRKTFRKK